jgi:hypothetical protein
MHVIVESKSRGTIANILVALLDEQVLEDSVLMISFSKSSGKYRATADIGGPEPSAP